MLCDMHIYICFYFRRVTIYFQCLTGKQPESNERQSTEVLLLQEFHLEISEVQFRCPTNEYFFISFHPLI